MNFNSPNDFYQFLTRSGLSGLSPETQNLVSCMDALSRMCACDPQEAKQAKLGQCKQHYLAFASKAQGFSNSLLSKTNNEMRICFYLNKQLISTINR